MRLRFASFIAPLIITSSQPAFSAQAEGVQGYLADFCRLKGVSMQLALMYYRDYNGNRSEVRNSLFSLWREKGYDPRLQSNFIEDIEGFLDILDEKRAENPSQVYAILNSEKAISAVGNRTEQDCIVKAGKIR